MQSWPTFIDQPLTDYEIFMETANQIINSKIEIEIENQMQKNRESQFSATKKFYLLYWPAARYQ